MVGSDSKVLPRSWGSSRQLHGCVKVRGLHVLLRAKEGTEGMSGKDAGEWSSSGNILQARIVWRQAMPSFDEPLLHGWRSTTHNEACNQ